MSTLASMELEQNDFEVVTTLGFAVSFSRPVVTSVSAGGTVTPGTSITAASVGTFVSLSAYTENREERNTLAQRKVKALHVLARGLAGFEPQPQDLVTIDSSTWRVEGSTPDMPAGELIAHTMIVVKL
jgi:hypothetical protein